MASINVESKALSDPRFRILARLAGLADADHARGKALRVWAECLERGAYALSSAIVDAAAEVDGFAVAMVKAGLAEPFGEGVRICGTEGRIEWLAKKRAASKAGGDSTRAKWQATRGPNGPVYAIQEVGPNEGPSSSSASSSPPSHPERRGGPGESAPSAPIAPADAGPLPGEPSAGGEPERKPASKARKAPALPEPPASWSPALCEAWQDWLAHRRETGHPIRPTGARQQLAGIESWGETVAIAAIRHSIAGGYQGLFEPRQQGGPTISRPAAPRPAPKPAAPAPWWEEPLNGHEVGGMGTCRCGATNAAPVVKTSPHWARLLPCPACLSKPTEAP